jgi:hypothetical protein
VFISALEPNYFAGFPGFYLSGGEGLKGSDTAYHMTVLGPQGLRKRLETGFGFMGGMDSLRPIEFTNEDSMLE